MIDAEMIAPNTALLAFHITTYYLMFARKPPLPIDVILQT